MIFCTFSITYPMARLLDFLVGPFKLTYFKKKELYHLVDNHARSNLAAKVDQSDRNASMFIKHSLDDE